jgi:hypothetical protein
MDRRELERVLNAEGRSRYLQVGPPLPTTANRVCVYPVSGQWEIVITDERAVPLASTRRIHPDESSALSAALHSIRMLADVMAFSAPSAEER